MGSDHRFHVGFETLVKQSALGFPGLPEVASLAKLPNVLFPTRPLLGLDGGGLIVILEVSTLKDGKQHDEGDQLLFLLLQRQLGGVGVGDVKHIKQWMRLAEIEILKVSIIERVVGVLLAIPL